MRTNFKNGLLAATIVMVCGTIAQATIPYTPLPVPGPPIVGPGMHSPRDVYGKELSHDRDYAIGPVDDPQQVILWDGMGGTANGVDFSGSRPEWQPDQQVDAIANTRDSLFHELLRDEAHLIFSHDDEITVYTPAGPSLFTVPSAGPIFLGNGNMIGGAGELSYEFGSMFGSPDTQGLWATQPEIDGMPFPVDVDGTEVWGKEPEPGQEPGGFIGDTDKYSLQVDSASAAVFPGGVSVWNASGTPYIPKPMIDFVVTSLLGAPVGVPTDPYSDTEGQQAINLDALMVFDRNGDPDHFDTSPGGNGEEVVDQNGELVHSEQQADMIVFSIKQLVDFADPDGYYATGSELFFLDGTGAFGFLAHGGHLWDHGYTLATMSFGLEGQEEFQGVLDINAIEAIGSEFFVPPTATPGDFNGDGYVDAADYTLYRDNLGGAETSVFPGTTNGNGTIGSEDYDLWRANFGTSPAPVMLSGSGAGAGGVPEPSTVAMLVLGSIGLVLRVRRK